MTYIVDASVVCEYIVVGSLTSHAEAFFEQISAEDILIVPEFCLLECTNVIWKQVRFNGMSIKDAKDNLKSIRLLKLKRVPMKRLLERTLEIAVKHNLAVYDSSYIALGLHLNYPLITIDEKQAKIAQAEGVTLIPITNFNL